MTPTHHTCSYFGFMWEPGEPGRHSCAFYLKAAVERLENTVEALKAELADQAPYAAVAAIAYALGRGFMESPMDFLRCWNEGDFEAVRNEWPEVPDEVFIGADPLFVPKQERAA